MYKVRFSTGYVVRVYCLPHELESASKRLLEHYDSYYRLHGSTVVSVIKE